jgi:hypothetical protein
MNALLINPWICDFSAYDLWSKPLGLLPDADPLLHNNIAFSYLYGQDRLHEVKDLVHRLNKR